VPTIPLYYHQPQVPSARGVRASPNMLGVQDAARRQMGEAFEGLRNDLQEAKDYRVKKELELARNEAWGQFENSLKERGEEEKWAEQWEKQSAEVAKPFLQNKGLSLKARQELEFEQKAWEQKTRLGVQNLATQRGIEVSKQVAFAAADSAWDNGDEQGATKVYAEMVQRKLLDGRLVPHLVEKGRARMQVVALLREIDVAANLPPAQGYVALDELRERLQAKAQGLDALTDKERLARLGQVEKGQRALQGGMLKEARNILKGIEKGDFGGEAIGAAVEAGAIDETIARALGWSPEANAELKGALGAAVGKREQLQAKAELTEARANTAKFEQFRARIRPSDTSGGSVGLGDIEQARKLGFISEAQAEQLRAEVREQLEFETGGYVYRAEMAKVGELVKANVKNWSLTGKFAAGLGVTMLNPVAGVLSVLPLTVGWEYYVDSNPEEWRKRFEAVGKLNLSKEGRIAVAKSLMAVRMDDLMDGEEAVEGSIFDRRVSKPEVEVRRALKDELATHAAALGPRLIGELFLNLEEVVREDFDQYKGKPPVEVVDALKERVKARVQRAAAGRQLGELYELFGAGGAGAINYDFAERGGRAVPQAVDEEVEPADIDEDGWVDLGGYAPRGGTE